jgi:hypothetical protein
MKLSTKLPFAGFYNSIYSFDDYESEYIRENYSIHSDVSDSELTDLLSQNENINKYENEVSKAYADSFFDYLSELLETDIKPDFEFEQKTSPKYYNFETDKIYCKVSIKYLQCIIDKIGIDAIQKQSESELKSRSGFISFYDYDIGTWGDLETWDYNQTSIILNAAINTLLDYPNDLDLTLYYAIGESIYNAWNNCVNWAKFESDIDELNNEKKLENGEIDELPEYILIPAFSGDVKKYVSDFDELNRLVK